MENPERQLCMHTEKAGPLHALSEWRYVHREGWTNTHPKWMTSKHQGEFSSKPLKLKAHNWFPSFPFSKAGNLFHDPMPKTEDKWVKFWGIVSSPHGLPSSSWACDSVTHNSIKPPLPHLGNGDGGDTQLKQFCFSLIMKNRNSCNEVLNIDIALGMQQAFAWC